MSDAQRLGSEFDVAKRLRHVKRYGVENPSQREDIKRKKH